MGCCPKFINPDNKCLDYINRGILVVLFVVGLAEMIGLFVYLDVYNNLDATACCGGIVHDTDDETYLTETCSEANILNGAEFAYADVNGRRICTVAGTICDTNVEDDMDDENYGRTLESCFYTESDFTEVCGGWAGLLDAEENAGSKAVTVIIIALVVLFLDFLISISEFMQWRAEWKGKDVEEWKCVTYVRKCMDCTCCCKEGGRWSYFSKLFVWIILYVMMDNYVEGALDQGFIGEGWDGYADSAYQGIASEAEDVCDLNSVTGFLYLKYHNEVPGSVSNGFYGFVTDVGLAMAITQFLLGFGVSFCAKESSSEETSA